MSDNRLLRGMAGFNQSTKSRKLVYLHPDSLYVEEQDRNDWESIKSKESLQELIDSIKADNNTINQPLLIEAKESDRYLVIDGERRWRAGKKLNITAIPCIICHNLDSKQKSIIQLTSNLQRQNLSPIQLATAINRRMEEYSLSTSEVAEEIGYSVDKIYKFLKLLKISPVLQKLALDGIATDPRSLSIIDKMHSEEIEKRAKLLREGAISVSEATKKTLPSEKNTENATSEKPLAKSISISISLGYLIYSRMVRKTLNQTPENNKIIKKYFKKLEKKLS